MDAVIQQLYGIARQEDWREARESGLKLITTAIGAYAAAWLSTGESGRSGPFTMTPGTEFNRSKLESMEFPDHVEVLEFGGPTPCSAYRVEHRHSSLVSVFCLVWALPERSPPESLITVQRAELPRLLTFLVDASMLAMNLFVARDEWLKRMGRNNRGAAALVDEQGWIYAATSQFAATLGFSAPGEVQRLPFALPENIIDSGGAFEKQGVQLRALRMDGLLLMHARKPLPLDVLSPREREIARVLSTGKTFKSVATQCGIAVSTVANHAARIYRKLGVYRREELMELLQSPHSPPAPKIKPK